MTDYQKHTTHTDALDTLGSIISADEKRDAIHLAVFPVEAFEPLRPGDHVKLEDGKAWYAVVDEVGAVGIVDPFLTGSVRTGQWFWLVVYPRQINSLRHVWEHDAFPTSGESVPAVADDKQSSEAWLREWVSNADCPSFETVIGAAIDGPSGWNSEALHFNEQDAHGGIPPEFWHHLSIYTGREFDPADNPSYFSCSC